MRARGEGEEEGKGSKEEEAEEGGGGEGGPFSLPAHMRSFMLTEICPHSYGVRLAHEEVMVVIHRGCPLPFCHSVALQPEWEEQDVVCVEVCQVVQEGQRQGKGEAHTVSLGSLELNGWDAMDAIAQGGMERDGDGFVRVGEENVQVFVTFSMDTTGACVCTRACMVYTCMYVCDV